MIIVVA
jgi:hypothetical protein